MMTWLGVPILDWVVLAVVLGLGVEAWVTIRKPDTGSAEDDAPAGTTPPKAQHAEHNGSDGSSPRG